MKTLKAVITGVATGLCMMSTAALADPTDDFGWVMVAQVHDGTDAGSVDAMIEDIMDVARNSDGVLVFNFARVEDKIYGYEMFDNQAAYFGYLSQVEPLIPKLLELWAPTAFVPTHELPDSVREVMTQMGASQPDMVNSLLQ